MTEIWWREMDAIVSVEWKKGGIAQSMGMETVYAVRRIIELIILLYIEYNMESSKVLIVCFFPFLLLLFLIR